LLRGSNIGEKKVFCLTQPEAGSFEETRRCRHRGPSSWGVTDLCVQKKKSSTRRGGLNTGGNQPGKGNFGAGILNAAPPEKGKN